MTETTRRKATYKLYPNEAQTEALYSYLRHHQQLYNACLEERKGAWEKQAVAVSAFAQMKDLTALRKEMPELQNFYSTSQQQTIKRLDRAFQAFFRRVKAGETPGYPRFKAFDRFAGWGYTTHASGWKFLEGEKRGHRIKVSGIGEIRARGQRRFEGEPKTLDIMHRDGRWTASITFKCNPTREAGTEALAFDWGLNHFATLSTGEQIDNPRLGREHADKLADLKRALARKKRGSNGRKRARAALSTFTRKVANKRKDFLHKQSAALVARSAFLATETLQITNMTRSAKGTVEEPGRMVAQKAGLNREVLDTAPATFTAMCAYKAEEAGIKFVEINTRKAKPSQTCPECGAVKKKTLAERWHSCECGAEMDRDHAAATVILNYALRTEEQSSLELAIKPRKTKGKARKAA